MRMVITAIAIFAFVSSCYEGETSEWSGGLGRVDQPLAEACTIRIGSGGSTHTFSATLAEGEVRSWDAVPASEFVRSTSGPCHFRIYNGRGEQGASVVLGTNLGERIRAGIDGLSRKDTRGGDTWQIRSLRIERTSPACKLRVGGNGVRMDYQVDYVSPVPALDRLDRLTGDGCAARVYAGRDFGASDPHRRAKSLHASSDARPSYDPGFAVGSLIVWSDPNDCPAEARDQGRCLPNLMLSRSLFVLDSALDQDRDGLHDALENELAQAFAALHSNHSSENATRSAIYVDADGQPVTEPATLFQVTTHGVDQLRIQYMRLWRNDVWGSPTCPGHVGDSQRHTLYLGTSSRGTADFGRFWYVTGTGGGIQDDLAWQRGDDSLRGATFVRRIGETGAPRHLAIYFSKGKHHEYADTGWSGRPDKECAFDLAYVDGEGHLHDPAYPARLASLRAPIGAGDRFDYTNVGSRDHPSFDDLAAFGFPGECVWSCGDFYAANAPNRGFD